MQATDPISVVYQAICSSLIGFPDWAKLIPGASKATGNFLHYDSLASDLPKRITPGPPADQPQIVLLESSSNDRISMNSRAVGIDQYFPLIVVNRDMQVLPFNQIKWQTFRALYAAGPSLGTNGLLKAWQIQVGRDNPFGTTMWNKGQVKWESILTIYCQIYVPNENVVSGVLPGA